MSLTLSRATTDGRERWDEYVQRSRQGGIFHQFDALEVLAAHADATLHPLVGYEGEEPVGLFPVFEARKWPITLAFSPPPELRVTYLGPALLHVDKLSQRKRESRHRRFIDQCIEWIDDEIGPDYASVRTGVSYGDVRPFKWNGFDVTPSYTYVVDLSDGEEAVMGRFSSSTRRYIRKHEDGPYRIEERGRDAVETIVSLVVDRFEEQGRSTPLQADFVADLYDRLPDGQVRPYVFVVDDDVVTGTLLLRYGSTVHRWQGGVKPEVDLPANELLEWRMMRDAMDRGATRYELVDANVPRINAWKAKFGPDLRTYHNMKRSAPGLDAASRLYTRINERELL